MAIYIVLLARQTFGVTSLNYGTHTQLDFESNIGGIPTDISSHCCAKRKSAKKKKKKKKKKE